jgi:hypothetical protein
MTWLYQGREFTEEDIGDAYGYVYRITNSTTNRKYIGKKFFSKAGYKQVKGKRKKIRKPSDWLTYWGSNKNYKKKSNSMVKTNTPERYYTSVKLVVNVPIGKLGRYL